MENNAIEINAQTGEVTYTYVEPIEINHEARVPQVITSRQLRLQWVMSGHDLSDIDNAIDQLPEAHKEIARINWEYAGTFDRHNDLLLNVADSLGITPEQLDELFILASAL